MSESGSDDKNDLQKLLEHFPVQVVMGISFGKITLDDCKAIVKIIGRPEIKIGDGLTLLHQAAQFDRTDLIDFLCEEGHDTEVKTLHGETALDQAAWRGNRDAVMRLICHNADVDCQTNLGYTPLHRCAFYNHPAIASLLCLGGADRTICDTENNETPYQVAVSRKNTAVANLLEPMLDENGNDISGKPYERNNSKHPEFRKEAREALLRLDTLEKKMRSA